MSGDEEQVPPTLEGLPPPPPPGATPPPPGELPPPPAPVAPMPPEPTEIPPPPAPTAPMPPPPVAPMPPPPAEMPPPPVAPMPAPPAEMPPPPVAPMPAPPAEMPPPPAEIPPPQSITDRIDLSTFRSSESNNQNPDQMYGHIDRIATGNVGTLLDRFSNRFGSDLDREIIVLRKKEQQAMREVKPTIELLSTPGESDTVETSDGDDDDAEFSTIELEELKSRIEEQIRPLKKRFDEAKKKRKTAEVRKLQPELKQMVDDRKLVIAALEGDADPDDLEELFVEYPEEIEVEVEAPEIDSSEDDNDFMDFVELANELLGMMPDDFQKSFLSGSSFEFYKEVFSSPDDADEDARGRFVDLINNELSSAPDAVLVRLKQDIDLARRVKVRYG